MGASGSGKSTLLKLIYGLFDAATGTIFWNNEQVLGPEYHLVPGMSFMKYLAQDFDLMPYVTAAENVGRFLSNFYLQQKAERVAELLDLVEMSEFASVKAQFLSGGQMQRVALARVLALEPELLLLDEPFSHIDPHQKNRLSQHLFQYCKEKGITVLFTSHTPDEALMFADEILVLDQGKLITQNTPEDLYRNPTSLYVGQLLGTINQIPGKLVNQPDRAFVLVRPEQWTIAENGLLVEVLQSYFNGKNYLIETQHNDLKIFLEAPNRLEIGSKIYIKI